MLVENLLIIGGLLIRLEKSSNLLKKKG